MLLVFFLCFVFVVVVVVVYFVLSFLFFLVFNPACFCMLSVFAKVFERKVWRVQVAHLHNAARLLGVFNCQHILTKISFVIFVLKKNKQIECRLAWHWWNSTDLGLIYNFFTNQNAEIVACKLSFRKSYHKPNLESTSKYGFFLIWGEKWRRSEHAHASYPVLSFRPPGFSPYIWGGKKGEFRDWTKCM